ncbi:MAG TPA: PrgI family protein [Candidatus Paceibacterota bacterium]|nr:PrgI family protein [Candidatus Paceibacterota bacterium]
MEYQVPQFIEVEEKVFGPLSIKQFVYVAGGFGLCAVLVLYLPRIIGIALAIPLAIFTLALAFYKVNNRPFLDVLESGFNYYLGSRLYLWKRVEKKTQVQTMPVPPTPAVETRQKLGLSQNKLHELAWSLDIKDSNAS